MVIELNPEYLKSSFSNPFNWTGSKHRYLKDLFDVLPGNKELRVLDPFVGGGDLISKLPSSWVITASDKNDKLIELHRDIQRGKITVDEVIKMQKVMDLSDSDVYAYGELRSAYNAGHNDPILLYLLICHSNTNRMRFNQKGEFNMPFGERTFNPQMQKKLDNYIAALSDREVRFYNHNFMDWDFNPYDLLLLDPPYQNTTAVYNERGGWSLNDEIHLYSKTSSAVNNGTKFIMFGQTWSKGAHNQLFDAWSSQYNVRVLKETTNKCSSNRKGGKTVEIMVCN